MKLKPTGGYTYEYVKDDGSKAIFKQMDGTRIVAYEVHKIFPSRIKFFKSCGSLEAAEKHINQN